MGDMMGCIRWPTKAGCLLWLTEVGCLLWLLWLVMETMYNLEVSVINYEHGVFEKMK